MIIERLIDKLLAGSPEPGLLLTGSGQFLQESRYKDAKEKYLDQVGEDIFSFLATNDPSHNYKYLDWMLSRFVYALKTEPDLDRDACARRLLLAIKAFDDNPLLSNRDIYQLGSLSSLELLVQEHDRENIEFEKIKKDTDFIYEDDDWLIIAPKTRKASGYWGKPTRWCISVGKTSYWDDYYYENSIVMVKEKKADPDSQWSCIVGEAEPEFAHAWDQDDDQFPVKRLLDKLPENAVEEIKNHFEYDDVNERRMDREEEQVSAKFDDGGRDEMLKAYLARADETEEVDVDDFEEELKDILGDDVDSALSRAWYGSYSYHGFDNIGYVRDLKQYNDFLEDQNYVDAFAEALRCVQLPYDQADQAMEIIQNTLGTKWHDFLIHQPHKDTAYISGYESEVNSLRDALAYAINLQKKKTKGPRLRDTDGPLLFTDPDAVPIQNLANVLDILDRGGEFSLADRIRRALKESLSVERLVTDLVNEDFDIRKLFKTWNSEYGVFSPKEVVDALYSKTGYSTQDGDRILKDRLLETETSFKKLLKKSTGKNPWDYDPKELPEVNLAYIKSAMPSFFSRSNQRLFGTRKIYKYPGNFIVLLNQRDAVVTRYVVYRFERLSQGANYLMHKGSYVTLDAAKKAIKKRDFSRERQAPFLI